MSGKAMTDEFIRNYHFSTPEVAERRRQNRLHPRYTKEEYERISAKIMKQAMEEWDILHEMLERYDGDIEWAWGEVALDLHTREMRELEVSQKNREAARKRWRNHQGVGIKKTNVIITDFLEANPNRPTKYKLINDWLWETDRQRYFDEMPEESTYNKHRNKLGY